MFNKIDSFLIDLLWQLIIKSEVSQQIVEFLSISNHVTRNVSACCCFFHLNIRNQLSVLCLYA